MPQRSVCTRGELFGSGGNATATVSQVYWPDSQFARGRFVLRTKWYEGDDVCGPDPRMCALVLAQVDSVCRGRDPGEKGLHKVLPGADDREDRAVVVPVGVNVEQPGRLREGALEVGDDFRVTPLREVRHGFER